MFSTKAKLIVASVLSKFLRFFLQSSEATVTRQGARFKLNLKQGVDVGVYTGLYERSTVRGLSQIEIPDGAAILDVGANIGYYSLLFSVKHPKANVYAFEPSVKCFDALSQNLLLNPLIKNLTVLHSFVSLSEEPPKTVYASWPLDENSNLHPEHFGALEATAGAEVWSIDGFCARNQQINDVGLIKIDVDGYEMDVLRSARNTLRKSRPSVLIEIAPYLLDQKDFFKFMDELDYQVMTLNGKILNKNNLHKFVRSKGGSINALCLPE